MNINNVLLILLGNTNAAVVMIAEKAADLLKSAQTKASISSFDAGQGSFEAEKDAFEKVGENLDLCPPLLDRKETPGHKCETESDVSDRVQKSESDSSDRVQKAESDESDRVQKSNNYDNAESELIPKPVQVREEL